MLSCTTSKANQKTDIAIAVAESNMRQAQTNNVEGKRNTHERTQERIQKKNDKKTGGGGGGGGGGGKKHITIEMSSTGKKNDEGGDTSDEEGYDRRRGSKTTVI